MRTGFLITCHADTFDLEGGVTMRELADRFGCEVEYLLGQTGRGQTMTNIGCHREAVATEASHVENFSGYQCIVGPSGSCAHQARKELTDAEQAVKVS